MIFSMIFEAQIAGPTPETEQRTFHDCVEQAVLAEKWGFDRIWAVEHHALAEYAHMSAPEIFLAFSEWSATRTKQEIYHAAQALRVPAGMVATVGDLLESPQYAARDF